MVSVDDEASTEFAKAHAARPRLVGEALRQICEDPEVESTLFSVLETQEILNGSAKVIMMSTGAGILPALKAGREVPRVPYPMRG